MPQDYQARQDARRERLEDRADKARTEASSRHHAAHTAAQAIPFGQPVLLGHHSEGRDRRYRGRIAANFDKSFAASKEADELDARAAAVGTGGISSDDPEAVTLLRDKVALGEALQARMVATNRVVRKKDPALLVAMGYTEERAARLLTPDFCGRVGFPDYELTNNSANVRRMKARIAELTQRAARPTVEVVVSAPDAAPAANGTTQGVGYIYRDDTDENRVMFEFEGGKPSDAVRAILKSHAFKWSPTRGAWVRLLTGSGRYAGECVHRELTALLAR